MMKPSNFQNVIRMQFDSLVKRTVCRTVKNYQKAQGRYAKRMVSFSELSEADLNGLSIVDTYELDCTCFEVMDNIKIKVNDTDLSNALKKLSERKRDIVLMFYYLEMTDSEIADLLNVDRKTSFCHRKKALDKIKKILDEEKVGIWNMLKSARLSLS